MRYRVNTTVPTQLKDRGFVAYVEDAEHPDGSGPASMSWHLSVMDADRVANAMNRLPRAGFSDSSVECPYCHWGFAPAVIEQHKREKHGSGL